MSEDFWKKKKDPNSQPDGRWCPVCKSFNHSGNIFCISCGKNLFEQGGQSSDGIAHGSSEIGSQEINQPDDILPRDDIINRDDILPRDDIINRDDILPRDDIINRDDILPRDDIINRDDAAQLNMKMQRKGQGQENKPLEIRENTENIPRIGQVPEGLPPLEIKDTENIPRIGQLPEERKLDPSDIQVGSYCPVCMAWIPIENKFCMDCGTTNTAQDQGDSGNLPQEDRLPEHIPPEVYAEDNPANTGQDLGDPGNFPPGGHLPVHIPPEVYTRENIPRPDQVPDGLPPLEIKDTENIPRVGQLPGQPQPPLINKPNPDNIPRIGQLPEERKLDPDDIQVGSYCPVCKAWIPIEKKFCTKCGNPYQHPEPQQPPLQNKPAALEGKPWGTFVPTSGGASISHQASRKTGRSLIWERWYSWLPILIGLIIGIFISFGNWIEIPLGTWISLIFPPEITEIILPDPGKTTTPKPRVYSGADPTPTVRVISLDDSSQDDTVYVPPVSNDSDDMCAVFSEIEILKTMMMRMKECNPSLTFYFKMDTDIPGLADPSSGDWEYWVDLGGHEGYCFLDPSYPDRLYCRADISASDAFTKRNLELFAYGCNDPIFSQLASIPELEGCSASPSEPDQTSCTSGEIIGSIDEKSTCESQGYKWEWDGTYHRCYCP